MGSRDTQMSTSSDQSWSAVSFLGSSIRLPILSRALNKTTGGSA